ncbi:TPA: viral A-type inclusion protein [Bacillus pacificus]|uniref:viral A-type inclusion protein n=1 Tax=Bacillus cereus group TaxID=86661 RepID=UPI003847B793|nr:viral A-type inclusion protein [Bacillus pacificus]
MGMKAAKALGRKAAIGMLKNRLKTTEKSKHTLEELQQKYYTCLQKGSNEELTDPHAYIDALVEYIQILQNQLETEKNKRKEDKKILTKTKNDLEQKKQKIQELHQREAKQKKIISDMKIVEHNTYKEVANLQSQLTQKDELLNKSTQNEKSLLNKLEQLQKTIKNISKVKHRKSNKADLITQLNNRIKNLEIDLKNATPNESYFKHKYQQELLVRTSVQKELTAFKRKYNDSIKYIEKFEDLLTGLLALPEKNINKKEISSRTTENKKKVIVFGTVERNDNRIFFKDSRNTQHKINWSESIHYVKFGIPTKVMISDEAAVILEQYPKITNSTSSATLRKFVTNRRSSNQEKRESIPVEKLGNYKVLLIGSASQINKNGKLTQYLAKSGLQVKLIDPFEESLNRISACNARFDAIIIFTGHIPHSVWDHVSKQDYRVEEVWSIKEKDVFTRIKYIVTQKCRLAAN